MNSRCRALSLYGSNLPIGSLDAYIQRVNNIPLLTVEQEHQLAIRLHDKQDLEAARQLVMAHLRYVVRVAKSYSGYGLPVSDLIQEGNIGLMKAVKKFNPHQGVRLVSFAVHWIKAEIHEFIVKNWKLVKIATTKAQRKLFFNLRSMKKRLGWFSKEEVNAVAQDLGVKPEEVMHMEQRLNSADESFDPTIDANDDSAFVAPVAYLAADDSDPVHSIEVEQSTFNNTSNLERAFATLDDRSKDIIQKRWLQEKKANLTELAKKYNVSAERIRQIENNAIRQLRLNMQASS